MILYEVRGNSTFALKKIASGSSIGTALQSAGEGKVIRTPLGKAMKHSDAPNAEMVPTKPGIWELRACQDISKGDEILVNFHRVAEIMAAKPKVEEPDAPKDAPKVNPPWCSSDFKPGLGGLVTPRFCFQPPREIPVRSKDKK
jgi:hypothetical protein